MKAKNTAHAREKIELLAEYQEKTKLQREKLEDDFKVERAKLQQEKVFYYLSLCGGVL